MAYKTVTDATFQSDVLKSSTPVVVDFWAPWCGPCRIVGPIIEQLAEEYGDKVVVAKVDVDENPQTASQYGVMSIPTIAFFKGGQPVKTVIGAQPKEVLKKAIDELLG